MAAKLSKKAETLLREMKNGVEVHYMPYRGRFNPTAYYTAWSKTAHLGRCTAQVKALLARGLAKKIGHKQYSSDHDVVLTDAGRAYDFGATKGAVGSERPEVEAK